VRVLDRGQRRTVDGDGNIVARGRPVVVQLEYVFTPVAPLLEQIIEEAIGTDLKIAAYSSMFVED
jgi:hypothetical protein